MLWCGIAAAYAVRLAGWSPDDFFITYRYAWNLAHGYGFVFNPGERVFGTTDPGLGLLLGLLQFLTGAPVPLLSAVVFCLSLIGIATVVLIEARRQGYAIEAVLGGSLLVASSYLWVNEGAAAPLALLLLMLAARDWGSSNQSSYVGAGLAPAREGINPSPTLLQASLEGSKSSMFLAGLVAGAAVWVRPDAGLGILLLAIILSDGRKVPWRFLLASGCVIAAGLGLAWLYFGHPLPNTLGAKTDMATATPNSWSGFRFWLRALGPLGRHFGIELPAVLIAGAIGCWPLAMRAGRPGRLLVLFGLAIAAVYPLLGVPFYSWYILPCVITAIYGVAFFAGAGARGLAERAPSLPYARDLFAVFIFASLTIGTFLASGSFFRDFVPPAYMQSYRRGAEWIKANSPTEASIAYVEIGVLGYYSERPILDLMGLVTPRARPYVVRNDILGALKEQPTDFVLFHTRGRMGPIVSSRWFRRRYREVVRFEDAEGGRKGALNVYRRRSRTKETARMPRTRDGRHVPRP